MANRGNNYKIDIGIGIKKDDRFDDRQNDPYDDRQNDRYADRNRDRYEKKRDAMQPVKKLANDLFADKTNRNFTREDMDDLRESFDAFDE